MHSTSSSKICGTRSSLLFQCKKGLGLRWAGSSRLHSWVRPKSPNACNITELCVNEWERTDVASGTISRDFSITSLIFFPYRKSPDSRKLKLGCIPSSKLGLDRNRESNGVSWVTNHVAATFACSISFMAYSRISS